MIDLLVKLYIAAALLQIGISVSNFADCHSRECVQMFEKKLGEVLKIDWKPISVWPNEVKRLEK